MCRKHEDYGKSLQQCWNAGGDVQDQGPVHGDDVFGTGVRHVKTSHKTP